MNSLELKLPPLPLALGFGVVMWAIDYYLPMWADRSSIRTAIAIAFCVLAVAIIVTAIAGFRKVRTTVDPMHPEAASAIVTTGIYRITRNPMYLGFLLALTGWTIFLGNAASAVMPVIFVAYMNRFQISPEERALRAQFGAPYEVYLRSVRRWL